MAPSSTTRSRPGPARERADLSDSEPKVKVTDKRMFTPDGELRDDYRHLEETGDREADAAVGAEPAVAREAEPRPATEPAPAPGAGAMPSDPAAAGPSLGGRGFPEQPRFVDLLTALAEPIALFLGDVRLPDGRSTEDLEAARFHIDLLEVVQQKTAGNLSAEEAALLEDLLYRLRLRYVQKTG